MNAITLENDILNFNFPELEGFDYGFNIYGICHRGRTLIIDTGFRSQMRVLSEYLENQRMRLTHAVITHFHNDHISGLTALPEELKVLGSPQYDLTLSKKLSQTISAVSFHEPFCFGDHQLTFIKAPGHSPCSLLVDIDGRFLHAGDLLMGRYDGKRIVPWVQRENIREHIRSLEMLKGMGRNRILLSHGPELIGRKKIDTEIGLRLDYLNAVLETDGELSLEDALPGGKENWVSTEFFTRLQKGARL